MLRTLLVMSILVPGFFLALKDRFNALLLYLWYALFDRKTGCTSISRHSSRRSRSVSC